MAERFKHQFEVRGESWVWTSEEPHHIGLLRIKNSGSTDIGGEGLMKAFKQEDREVAIDFAKGQRDLPIHQGFKLKLVKLTPEEYTLTAQTGATGSHANCDHPSTPAARRDCRARRKAGIS